MSINLKDVKLGIQRPDGAVEWFEATIVYNVVTVRVPTLCKSCGTNLDYNQCFCEVVPALREPATVATTHVCELGEHCRCKLYDVAYQQDCWNWIEEVTR
jgi:hypothetical protein